MPDVPGASVSREEIEAAWQTFLELAVEAMEESLRNDEWLPGKGLVGQHDTLHEMFRRDRKKQ